MTGKSPARAPRKTRGGSDGFATDTERERFVREYLDNTSPQVVESLRFLVAREQLGDRNSFPSRLAVVSSVEGEGVTTVSRTLAAMIAHDLEANVCWVDLNFTDIDRDSAADSVPHLVDVLSERATIESALEATSNPRLTLLRAGGVSRQRRPVLARSPMLADLFAALDVAFQYVVIDVPPLLASSESLNLVRHARAYLLVVKHGETTIPQVRQASQELRSIPSLGVVLNQFEPHMPSKLQRLFAT